jgi:hypothetical protein
MRLRLHRPRLHAAHLVISSKLVLKFDGLLQSLESPFALLCLHGRDPQEFFDSALRITLLCLFGIVVFILNTNIGGVLFVALFVIEVIAITNG